MTPAQIIKEHMRELGRRGGKKTSDAKTEATKKSLEKARKARWPTKKGGRPKGGTAGAKKVKE
jgi:hypothetical protein